MSAQVGILRIDAPKLFREFQRAVLPTDLIELELLYKKISEAGALSDYPITRSKEVSFNPRPARLCQILISECHENSSEIFSAAMTMAFLLANPNGEPPLECFKFQPLALEALSLLHPGGMVGAIRTVSSERLALVAALDEVRHQHMSSLDDFHKAERVSHILHYLLPMVNQIEHQRLVVLIETALSRQVVNG